ncbi:MAG: TIGR00282 family metallophosphoesterase [Clostridia bacterium]|nr:TIGR00282 family metallophosphoesterase [Clostridia bacterium]
MKILAVGDVVGITAVEYLEKRLRRFAAENGVDAIIVNGENASNGNGLSKNDAERLLNIGADVVTTGNHVWQKSDIRAFLDETPYVLRPANYPPAAPGSGSTVIDVGLKRLLVVNLMGVSYLEPLESPFDTLDKILRENEGKYDFSVVDFHAEATGEKGALANCFDGRIDAIFGTHTHVQTNDARVLPGGTCFITDVGMTGSLDSILGVKKECIIKKLRYHLPVRFEQADTDIRANGVIFTIGEVDNLSAVAVTF